MRAFRNFVHECEQYAGEDQAALVGYAGNAAPG